MAILPEQRIPEPIHWCHEWAMRTLDCLGEVVAGFDPDQVRRMKDWGGASRKRKVGWSEGKPIAGLRDQYLEWSKYKEAIERFDGTQQAPVNVCGLIAPSAHAMLDQLVRRLLNGVWRTIIPCTLDEVDIGDPEQRHWPDAQLLAEADLDEIAFAIQGRRPDGQLTDFSVNMDRVNWLEAALQQEYARATARLPQTQGGANVPDADGSVQKTWNPRGQTKKIISAMKAGLDTNAIVEKFDIGKEYAWKVRQRARDNGLLES